MEPRRHPRRCRPGGLALYAGRRAAAANATWPERRTAVRRARRRAPGRWREAPLSRRSPSLRPVQELAWHADGLHLRLTAQGPWADASALAGSRTSIPMTAAARDRLGDARSSPMPRPRPPRPQPRARARPRHRGRRARRRAARRHGREGGGRPGRGRRDAPRALDRPHGRRRRHRRGREGRGADALQRRADRRRLAAARRHRRRPARGHAPHALGMPNALAVIARQRARDDVRPRARHVHGEARRRRGHRRPARPRRAARRDRRAVAERAAWTSATSWSSRSTARATRRASRRSATPARACGSSPTATSPASLLAVSDRSPVRPAVGHRRHARGRDLLGGDQVHRRRLRRAPVAARRRRAQGRARRRATTSTGS